MEGVQGPLSHQAIWLDLAKTVCATSNLREWNSPCPTCHGTTPISPPPVIGGLSAPRESPRSFVLLGVDPSVLAEVGRCSRSVVQLPR
jgi:hypothetical protein